MPRLDSLTAQETFEAELERVRAWYGSYITGYVVMLQHVHLLISEPEARRREQMGVALVARAHPPAKSAGRVGQPPWGILIRKMGQPPLVHFYRQFLFSGRFTL